MMKDRGQKQKLLQYFLSREWYPQLEVDIYYGESSLPKPKMITDIDVLAISVSPNGALSPIIGDCKTLKNQSPINRVFWIKGLMSYLGSDFGIVLLSKSIEGEHKLLANDLNVTLLSDEDFKIYSLATTKNNSFYSALSNLDCWDQYFDIPNKFPNLLPLYQFCKSGYWNEPDANSKLRHSIAKLQNVKSELNPANASNMFLFLELSSMFSLALNEVSIKIFNKYLWPKDKVSFDTDLKIHLWGGYENYQFLNQLRSRLITKQSPEPSELSLPEWASFVQLVRACLDFPLNIATTPLILKELAFQHLTQQETLENSQSYLSYLVGKSPQATKHAILAIDYLVKAAKLPLEFSEITTGSLMRIQRTHLEKK